jgi:ubiquinone/menaquinone biosynthesis C-methylase UbiE
MEQEISKAYYGDHIFYDDLNELLQFDDIPFYKKIVNKDMNILEVACGTGRITKEIAECVKSIAACDLSPKMLEVAKNNSNGKKINYFEADMRNLGFIKDKFDCIICGFNSLQHLLSDEDIMAFLNGCKKLLTKDGFLIVDIFNPNERFLNIDEVEEFKCSFISKPLNDVIELREKRHYDVTSRINHITSIYISQKNQKTWYAEALMRQYYPGQIEKIVTDLDMKVVEKYGNYDMENFTIDSPKQIFFIKTNSVV